MVTLRAIERCLGILVIMLHLSNAVQAETNVGTDNKEQIAWKRDIAMGVLTTKPLGVTAQDRFLEKINAATSVNQLHGIIQQMRSFGGDNPNLSWKRGIALDVLFVRKLDQVTHENFLAEINAATSVSELHGIIQRLRSSDRDHRLTQKRDIALGVLLAKDFDPTRYESFLAEINTATRVSDLHEIILRIRTGGPDPRFSQKRDIALGVLSATSFDLTTHDSFLEEINAAISIDELHSIILLMRERGSSPSVLPLNTAPSFVNLRSDTGDYIGQGKSFSYTQANAEILVSNTTNQLTVSINGDESWSSDFVLPDTYTKLQPGSYSNLKRTHFHDIAVGGLDWSGEGRNCKNLSGWIVIDSLTYEGDALSAIDLRFEQHCEGTISALHGELHWTSEDTTTSPGPVNPVSTRLWEADPNVLPDNGNFVYLESYDGDFIGQGNTYISTQTDALFSINASGNKLFINIDGDEYWDGEFIAMNSISRLEVGYYGELRRASFHNPAKGGMSWSGEGRGCNNLDGWFVIDDVTYHGNEITAIDLRFEQHCAGNTPALYGQIHWKGSNQTSPPGPVNPPPSYLWRADPSVVPAQGNYVYLKSDTGDIIGQGKTYTYTQVNSVLAFKDLDRGVSVSVKGDEDWIGLFHAMNPLNRLEVGYYEDTRGVYENPVKSGLEWLGEGSQSCDPRGWFIVDNVTYAGSDITAIDLRFKQQCNGSTPALFGQIHLEPNDQTGPPGPVNPIPHNLWKADPSVVPANGNYAYLISEPGDFVGQGQTYSYTQINSIFFLDMSTFGFTFRVNGNEDWSGAFRGMNTLNRLEPGYYGDLRGIYDNPAKGGVDWSGEARSCNKKTGWFVIDSVTYTGNDITAIDLRFEQRCTGGSSALNGQIHWTIDDQTRPPGPVNPPPANLWQAGSNNVPADGNYVYLESEAGDYIGKGKTYLYTQVDSLFSIDTKGNRLELAIDGEEEWTGYFKTMNTIHRFEVGYYGDLGGYTGNPAKGGLDWSGEGRGCDTRGWFIVDSLAYVGDKIAAIDLRFKQQCRENAPALYGRVHWSINDQTTPPGPVNPPPPNLWQADSNVVPTNGNYVYLESEVGEVVGQGGTYLYTQADSEFWFGTSNNYLLINGDTDYNWLGEFTIMDHLNRFETGYYGGIVNPHDNKAKAGMSWVSDRGCSTKDGWFVIDSVTYQADEIIAIDLRFEQLCTVGGPALRGQIHWSQ